jgi:hypothetical protein
VNWGVGTCLQGGIIVLWGAVATSANLTGERLADVRAVELLEWWGTAEARAVLAELAKGAPASDSTWAAAAALKRLSER